MIQKHRISTNIGVDQKITVELKQDFDVLEILSLKFSQQEIYTSLCSDYGVVCGRVTANNGLGIPNVKVSVFVPQKDTDSTDPVISALYPYTSVGDKNDEGYRYNLLPSRKQHGGHVPTGTFFDQQEILSREEVLEVYETVPECALFADEAFFRYCAAKIKIALGNKMQIFGYNLPGGISINADAIQSLGESELEKVIEEIKTDEGTDWMMHS